MDGGLIFKSLIGAFWQLFQSAFKLAIPILIFIILIIIMICFFYIKEVYINHRKPKKPSVPISKKPGIIKRLLIMFPKQLVEDLINQDPDAFNEFGIHMIVGEQGSGKTITAVYLLEEWRRKYPKLKCFTNFEYKGQDGVLEHWKELFNHYNGIYGISNVLDELQTWWSNADSKDLPPQVLSEICQQRKQKKATIGTCQVFGRLPKPFREQSHFVYIPYTFLNCITIVKKTKGRYYNTTTEKFTKTCGLFFFVHDKKLRESYDTFKRIQKYSDTKWAKSDYFSEEVPPMEVVLRNSDLPKK